MSTIFKGYFLFIVITKYCYIPHVVPLSLSYTQWFIPPAPPALYSPFSPLRTGNH